jgi:subtilisin-like proprotein convertase family protein
MPRITNRPFVPASSLRGVELKQDASKVVSTRSHDIQLSTRAGDTWLPDFKVERRQIADPEARPVAVEVSAARLAQVSSGAGFTALLKELLEANKEWLLPERTKLFESLAESERSSFAFHNIVGRRNEQFFDQVAALVGRTGLRGDEAAAARREVNFAHRDAFRGRTIDFDRADTGTYWSYGNDAPFVHVFEKMLAALPENDPKRPFIQNQIDYIFTHKYAPHGGVKELDIERSLELMAIDKASRQVVSMVKGTEASNQVRYETLTVPQSASGPDAGAAVYRDGDKYFLAGSGAPLAAELTDSLVRRPAGDIVFRRKEASESHRADFRYDWNGNRMLNSDRIDTGWWGHCDIKATIETILADMDGSGGVKEFNAASGVTTDFSRALQLEALAGLLNFADGYYNTRGGAQARFGTVDFAGGRFDDRPSKMTLSTDRGSVALNVRIGKLFAKDDPSKAEDLERIFATKLVDDKSESFANNPDILRVEQHDTNFINATGRKVEGQADGYTFNASGLPVESKTSFSLDPGATSGARVLIGSELKDVTSRRLERTYFDPATQNLIQVPTQFVEENGQFVAKEGTERVIGRLRGMELGREMMANDDTAGKLKLLDEAVRSGEKIAADSDVRMEVWNGEVHSVTKRTEWRSDDGRWERVALHVDATFGTNKVGSFLHKLDDNGKIVDTLELKAAVDFYYRDRPRVAPLISERGNWYVNRAMYDRGVVALGGDQMTSVAAVQDLTDLIYLGLKAKDKQQVFTIVHEGKRFVYEDEASWKADVARFSGDGTGGGGQPAGAVRVSSTPNLGIPDNDPVGISDKVVIDVAGSVTSIKVELDLKHTWVGDLDVAIVAPDGTEVTLHKRGGRSRHDIVGTYGDDLSAFERLDGLVGTEAKGEWTLKVTDLAGRDVGTLVSWGLSIETA